MDNKVATFLLESRMKILSKDIKSTIHVVTGNEACDLDSAVCAICLSYFLSQVEKEDDVVYVPLLNIIKKDYKIKTEVKYLFNDQGIHEKHLFFLDDLNLRTFHDQHLLKITLVDFNVFTAEQEYLNDVVVRVIDHHVSKRLNSNSVDVTIESVGSCATLVSEFMLKHENIADIVVAKLLYGAILIDTSCLKDKTKTTKKDVCIIEKIEMTHDFNRNIIYNSILDAKNQLAGLTFEELIKKDLKFVNKTLNGHKMRIAIPVIRMKIHNFFQEIVDAEEKSKLQLKETNSNALVIMFIDSQTVVKRFIAFYSENEDVTNQLINRVKSNKITDLKLEKINVTNSGNFICFEQLNVAASRKMVLPIIENL